MRGVKHVLGKWWAYLLGLIRWGLIGGGIQDLFSCFSVFL